MSNQKHPLLYDKAWVEHKYLVERLSSVKIGKVVGQSSTSVLSALKRFGVPRRTFAEASQKYPELRDKRWLKEKYVEKALSSDKVASTLGCTGTTVLSALEHFSIPIRKHTEAHNKYVELSDRALLESMYIKGEKSGYDIGAAFGCSSTAVFDALKRHGLSTRPLSEANKRDSNFAELNDKKWLYQKYWVEELSSAQMADTVGCTYSTVLESLKKHEIPRRTALENRKRFTPQKCRTSIEVKLEAIFDRYTDCIEYTGDSSFVIQTPNGNFNPDFIIRDKRIAIEANGDFWHSPLLNRNIKKGAVVTYRKGYLKDVGWRLIVFWEADINRDDAEVFVLHVLGKEGIV
jgi:G:T-mismatch repair DNA endonuclease (very short patch repair protein)/biotin operon repressor